MAKHKELVTVMGESGGETGKAILWKLDPIEYANVPKHLLSVWFPFSQVEEIHTDTIVVSRWILETKELYELVTNKE